MSENNIILRPQAPTPSPVEILQPHVGNLIIRKLREICRLEISREMRSALPEVECSRHFGDETLTTLLLGGKAHPHVPVGALGEGEARARRWLGKRDWRRQYGEGIGFLVKGSVALRIRTVVLVRLIGGDSTVKVLLCFL